MQRTENVSDIKYADLDEISPLQPPNAEKYRTALHDLLLSYQLLVRRRNAAYEPGGRGFESLKGLKKHRYVNSHSAEHKEAKTANFARS
jgi:hypothetical protein